MTVLIAGGGISGLALALSCHQVGIPFQVFEASSKMRPLGVGINLQPSAVRELFDLGLEDRLDEVGIRLKDYGLYTKKGLHVWTEPRGLDAGYNWPSYSVHRGRLQCVSELQSFGQQSDRLLKYCRGNPKCSKDCQSCS